ncbi:hypothetical protein [Winogradskyella rapida]|uniref:Uncharacterized protein n=1 Tax=Winogradskyella rapida TaxID=549701 RepID=A0ABW3KQ71_9FLAO
MKNKMNEIVLMLFVGIPILSILFGYFLWRSAMDNYGYNIYGIGVIIRLLIAGLVCIFDLNIGLALLVIVSIWNFITTLRNTSFFIALLAILFQPIALWFAISAINRFISAMND